MKYFNLYYIKHNINEYYSIPLFIKSNKDVEYLQYYENTKPKEYHSGPPTFKLQDDGREEYFYDNEITIQENHTHKIINILFSNKITDERDNF